MKITEILQKNAEAAKKYIDTLLKKKQDVLTFDTIPTADSKNPVTSNGIKKAIDACPDKNGTGARGTWPISVGGSSAIATKAKQDADGNVIPNTYVKRCEELVYALNDLKIGGLYAIQTGGCIELDPTYTDIGHPGSVLVIMNKANGATNSCTQIYTTFDTHNSYKREYDAVEKTWSAWRKYAFEDSTVARATTADNVSGKIYYSADSPSVATDKLFTIKQAKAGDDNVPNNGLVIQSGPTGAAYNGKLYITDNGADGVWVGGVSGGKEVGWTRLVENKGTWDITTKNIPTSDVGGNIWIA